MVAATEAERARLRQDLHDGLGPALSGVGLGLDAVQLQMRGLAPEAGELASLIQRLRDEVSVAVRDVRRIIDDLRPAALDGSDLVTALRQHEILREDPSSAADIRISLEVEGCLPGLPPDVEVAAYRIVLEAVKNARLHSGARTCRVTIAGEEMLTVRIRDDGHGFGALPDHGTAGRHDSPGVGLHSVRARARAAGGDCSIRSGPGGTTVEAVFPLGEPERPPAAAPLAAADVDTRARATVEP